VQAAFFKFSGSLSDGLNISPKAVWKPDCFADPPWRQLRFVALWHSRKATIFIV